MLTYETLGQFITAKPFRPFQIHMASGRTFFVGHPEIISVGNSYANIYQRPVGELPQGERWQLVSLLLMESAEPVDSNAEVESH